jgi:type I restriction enzyme, S subunit
LITANLGTLCTFVSGGTPRRSEHRYFSGDIPWITSADISGGSVGSVRTFITEEAVRESATNRVPAGTVLLVTRTGVGKVAVATRDLCFSQDITGLRPDPSRVDTGYLVRYLRTRQAHFERLARGATIKGIPRDVLTVLPVPLPPLPQQRRISAVLDRADILRVKRRAALARADSLIQALFFDLFGNPFRHGATSLRLGEVADVLMGQSPPGSSYNTNGLGTPLLNGPTEFGPRHPVAKQWTTAPTRLCQPGDVLFCVRGATAGRLNRADRVYCLGRGVAAIRPRSGAGINKEFLFTLLERYYDYFQTKGVGSTFINIGRDQLEDLPIPSAEPHKTEKLAQGFAAIEKLMVLHDTSDSALSALFASLQHRAFRGEL